MSIASRMHELGEYPDRLLLEPQSLEMDVNEIVADRPEVANVLAGLLLRLSEGIETEPQIKVIQTIDMIVELAFLKSGYYDRSYTEWRMALQGECSLNEEGRILRGEPTPQVDASDAERPAAEASAEPQRVADALALLLESEYTPDDLRQEIADGLCGIVDGYNMLDPEHVREWLPLALEILRRRNAQNAESQEGEGANEQEKA